MKKHRKFRDQAQVELLFSNEPSQPEEVKSGKRFWEFEEWRRMHAVRSVWLPTVKPQPQKPAQKIWEYFEPDIPGVWMRNAKTGAAGLKQVRRYRSRPK